MIQLKPVNTSRQINQIVELGAEIWREYYMDLLGESQISYMLKKFQSEEAISVQIQEEGFTYWQIETDGVSCGYCGFVRKENRLFLSKLYLKREFRGQGIGRYVMEALREEAAGLQAVYLTVNKYNADSIAAYKKLGFREIDAVVTDIGGGYVMDDYIMELPLRP